MSASSFTIVNYTNENILLAFLSDVSQNEKYAWKVVAPSQDAPFVQDIPDQVELITNYHLDGGYDPYGGQQSNPVWWDNRGQKPATYRALWNEAENRVDVSITDEQSSAHGLTLINESGRTLYVHPKFGTNELIAPITVLYGQRVIYNFSWPMSIAVVDNYSQYSPPNGELYVVDSLLSDKVSIDADQTATITGSKTDGYSISIS